MASVAELILRAGRAQADRAARSGEIWSATIGELGRVGARAYEGYRARKEEERKVREEQERDAQVQSLFESSNGEPDENALAKIVGRNEARVMLKGVYDLRKAKADAEKAAMPAELKPIPTRQITVRRPDGIEEVRIVEDKPGAVYENAPEPPKPVTPPNPTEASLALLAAQGDKAAAEALRRLQSKPEGKPDYEWVERGGKATQIIKGQSLPGDVPWTNPKSGVKRITSGDAEEIAAMDDSLQQANALMLNAGKTGAGSWIGSKMPDFVTEYTGKGTVLGSLVPGEQGIGEDSKNRLAEIALVKQIIGKALEGGVLRKEDEIKYAKILPTIGDAPEVSKAKVALLISMIEKKKRNRLDALDSAGYDVSGFAPRPEPQEAAKSQRFTIERKPDGTLYKKPIK